MFTRPTLTKLIADLADKPSMSSAELKVYFDNSPIELKDAIIKLQQELEATTGASHIGATVTGLTENTVSTLLTKLKSITDTNVQSLTTHKTSSDHDGRYYPKTEVDTKLGLKSDKSTTYTKTESDGRFTNKTGNHEGTWQGLTPTQVDQTINSRLIVLEDKYNSPSYSDTLIQNASIFTTGTGKNASGTDIDVSASVVEAPLTIVSIKGKTEVVGSVVKSTVNSKVVSRGKNKFDGELVRNESYSGTTGAIAVVSGYSRNKNRYIKLPNDTTKVIVSNNLSPIRSIIYWYDINKTFLSTTDITSQNAEHIKPTNAVFYNFSIATIDSAFIIWNSMNFITTYEPYKDSPTEINWTDGEGRSLPNGIYDEIKDGKEYKRTKEKVLASGDITSMYTGFANVDVALTSVFSDNAEWKANLIDNNTLLEGYTEVSAYSTTTTTSNYWSNSDNKLYIAFPKGTTLAQAQTALAGKSLIYQLANEVVTDVDGFVPLVGFTDGDIYIEPQTAGVETTVPTFEYKVPKNQAAQIDGNTAGIRINSNQIIDIYAVLKANGLI